MPTFSLVPIAKGLSWPNNVRPGILLVQATDEGDARSRASILLEINDSEIVVNGFNGIIRSRYRSRNNIYDDLAVCEIWLDHEWVDCYEAVSDINVENEIAPINLYDALSYGVIDEERFNLLSHWQSRVKSQYK